MAAFPVIVSASPFTITTGSTLTYQQFLATLAYISYKVTEMYIESDNIQQVSATFTWQHKNQNGRLYSEPSSSTVDPYQYSAVLLNKTADVDAIIDINTALLFSLRPNSYLEIMFFSETFSFSYLLNRDQNIVVDKQKVLLPAKQNNGNAIAAVIFLAASAFVGINLIKK